MSDSPSDMDHPWAARPEYSTTNDSVELNRLRALPLLAYERERDEAAKRLGIKRVSVLDLLVRGNGSGGKGKAGQGRPLEFRDVAPSSGPVDGAFLLEKLAGAIRSYVVLRECEADAAALWVIGTYAMASWTIFARLLIIAPTENCGKSTLLDVLSRLAYRALWASGITAAPLYRTIELARPTLLLDEADTYARDDERLRGVLDAGHHRDGAVLRCVGDDHEPRQFSVWAALALGAIGRLPRTVESRSIIIRLRRKRPDERVESLRNQSKKLDHLAPMAARWAQDHADELAAADPVMPNAITNRVADNWAPLFAIADLAGGGWAERARRAAAELSRSGEDSVSPGVQLLGDLRELFDAEPNDALFTAEILAELVKRDDRPWSEFRKGQPITARQLAALLKPFEVTTNRAVRRGVQVNKGYRRADLEDAWGRYCPNGSVTGLQMADSVAFGDIGSVTSK